MSTGGWCVTALLGRGAHGTTYLAGAGDGSRVALKVVPTGGDEVMVSDLLAISGVLRAIGHGQVMEWRAVEAEGARALVVMEYAAGGSLGDALRRSGRIPPLTILRWATAASDGLAAAHRRGLVHGDLKPSALLIRGSGEPVVSDFGLASVVAGTVGHGEVAGSVDYRDPALERGGTPDERGDVFSLALVLFEALCWARRPVRTDPDRMFLRRSGELRLERLPEEVPAEVAELIGRATDPDPRRRPASGVELSGLLREATAAAGQVSSSSAAGPGGRGDRGSRDSACFDTAGLGAGRRAPAPPRLTREAGLADGAGGTEGSSAGAPDGGPPTGGNQVFGRPRRLRRGRPGPVRVSVPEDGLPLAEDELAGLTVGRELRRDRRRPLPTTGAGLRRATGRRGRPRHSPRARNALASLLALAASLTILSTSPSAPRSSRASVCRPPATTALLGHRLGSVKVGRGCPETVMWTGSVATLVDSSGRPAMRFSFGEPGQLLVGHWSCRGAASPAFYDPSTGSVYLYAEWAPPGRPSHPYASISTGVESGTARVVHRGTCDTVMVTPSRSSRSGQESQ